MSPREISEMRAQKRLTLRPVSDRSTSYVIMSVGGRSAGKCMHRRIQPCLWGRVTASMPSCPFPKEEKK